MRKKLLAGLMAAAMAASALAGCGSGETAEPNAETGGTTADEADAGAEADNGEVVELEFWAWWSSEAIKILRTSTM